MRPKKSNGRVIDSETYSEHTTHALAGARLREKGIQLTGELAALSPDTKTKQPTFMLSVQWLRHVEKRSLEYEKGPMADGWEFPVECADDLAALVTALIKRAKRDGVLPSK
jgi:hypothetical protein